MVRKFRLSIPWAMVKTGYELRLASAVKQESPLKQERLSPLRVDSTDMWLSWREFTQMVHSLFQKLITMAIPTIPSVSYQEWIVPSVLPTQRNKKDMLTKYKNVSIFFLFFMARSAATFKVFQSRLKRYD